MTTMHCVRYKCTMPEATCVARQRRFEVQTRHGQYCPDPGCWRCDQGKVILKQFKKQEKKMEPVAIAAAVSSPARESDKNIKTCSRCAAVFEGMGAITSNFYRAQRTLDGYETYCKACRKQNRNEIRKAQKLVRPASAPAPKAPAYSPPVVPVPADLDEMTREIFSRSDCIDLFHELEEMAQREFRTVPMQMLFLLRTRLAEWSLSK